MQNRHTYLYKTLKSIWVVQEGEDFDLAIKSFKCKIGHLLKDGHIDLKDYRMLRKYINNLGMFYKSDKEYFSRYSDCIH